MSEEVLRNDGWVNLATGVGGPKDKSSGFAFSGSYIDQNWAALEQLYEEDHIAGRIVDAPVDAVFVEGYTFECSDQQAKDDITDAIDALEAEEAVDQAMRWERLYGGSAIFLGVDDGLLFDSPIRPERIRQLMYLHVLERHELWPHRFYQDPKSPKFGQPSHYRVSPTDGATMSNKVGAIVHESRLIIFGGEKTTKRKLIENQYWGQSVLTRAYTAIKQYGGSLASTLALMADASQGIYKIKGLMSIIQGGNEAKLVTRMKAQERLRSALNAILLDADGEDYTRIATQLTELGNLIDRFMLNVASAAKMPATEIFGRSAAGMNATGENDTRSWNKQVGKLQRQKGKPALERIFRTLLRASLGPTKGVEPDSWKVSFPPVWSPTAKEAAEIHKLKVETALLAQDAGVINEHQFGRGLFSGNEWDGEIVLTDDELKALKVVGMMAGMPETAPAAIAPVETSEAPPAEEQLTQDDEGEELAVSDTRALAERMTELGIAKCTHGKPNRCPICGIERNRSEVDVGPDGEPVWKVSWRPIGARAPVAEESDEEAS